MAQAKKDAESVKIEILRDGVFVADSVRCDTHDVANVSKEIAGILVSAGHARRK